MGEPQIIAEAIAAIGLHDIALSGRDTWTTSTRACEWNQRPRPRRGGLGGASGGHRTASFLCDGAVMLGRATTTRPHLRHAARPFGSGCTARPVPLHRAGLAGMAFLLGHFRPAVPDEGDNRAGFEERIHVTPAAIGKRMAGAYDHDFDLRGWRFCVHDAPAEDHSIGHRLTGKVQYPGQAWGLDFVSLPDSGHREFPDGFHCTFSCFLNCWHAPYPACLHCPLWHRRR